MKRIFILSVASMLSVGVYAQKDTIAEHYKTSKYDCAIFPAALAKKVLAQRDCQMFTPTHGQVDTVEGKLKESFNILDSLSKDGFKLISKHLDKYRRQYFGFTNKDNHTIFEIYCYWNDSFKEFDDVWLKDKVFKWDGGHYFWITSYDATLGRFTYIEIGGNE